MPEPNSGDRRGRGCRLEFENWPEPDRRRHGVHLWLRHYSRRAHIGLPWPARAADADPLTSYAAGYVNSASTATLASCFHIDNVPI